MPGDNLTNIAQVRIDGTAQNGAAVTLYDGTTAVGTGVADASTGAFSIVANSPLANGVHALTATAASAGQVSPASNALSVTVDTQPATAALTHGAETFTSTGETVTLTGTASAAVAGVPVAVAILQDGHQIGSATPSNGVWTFTANVTTALHAYTLQTTDAAGNVGTGANTLLLGAFGVNTIVGGPGSDLIVAGPGADTLTGGSADNTFIFNSIKDAPLPGSSGRHSSVTLITNWVSGLDHINLTALGPLTFGGQTSHVTPHSVEWFTSGASTIILGDAQGHSRPDFMIELVGIHNLTSSDFVLA